MGVQKFRLSATFVAQLVKEGNLPKSFKKVLIKKI